MNSRVFLSIAVIAAIVLAAMLAGFVVGHKPYASVATYLVAVIGAGLFAWVYSLGGNEQDDEQF